MMYEIACSTVIVNTKYLINLSTSILPVLIYNQINNKSN